MLIVIWIALGVLAGGHWWQMRLLTVLALSLALAGGSIVGATPESRPRSGGSGFHIVKVAHKHKKQKRHTRKYRHGKPKQHHRQQ